MSFNPTRKTYGAVDRRALISEHAVSDGIGCTVDVSAFVDETDVTNDTIPALYPVVVSASGVATPFAGTAGVPAVLSGFLINGGPVDRGDFGDGYIWHGALDPALIPGDFDVAGISNAHQFNFNGKA